MNSGNSLFHARKKCGLSQEDVAEKLGVSRQAVSKWETDETLPDAVSGIGGKTATILYPSLNGAQMNWAFVKEGLVDEISLVMTPVIDGATGSLPVFQVNPKYNQLSPKEVRLLGTKQLNDGSLHLRFERKSTLK